LKSGDQVEIITSDTFHPHRDWLNIAITAKAKAAIKTMLKADTKNRIEKGKKILEEKLLEIKLRPSARVMRKLLPAYEVANKDELYSKIGTGIIQLESLHDILKKNTISKWVNYWSLQLGKTSEKVRKPSEASSSAQKQGIKTPLLLSEGMDKAAPNYILAKCCNPIPGDNVVGFMQERPGDRAIIHQSKCPEAIKLLSSHSELFMPVKWTSHRLLSFLVKIKTGGTDRFGIFHDITTVITEELNVNIRGINLTSHDGIWESTLELYVHDTKDVNNLIMGLSRIKGVETVERTESVQ